MNKQTNNHLGKLIVLLALVTVTTMWFISYASSAVSNSYQAISTILDSDQAVEIIFPGIDEALYITDWGLFTNTGPWTYSGPGTSYDESYTPPELVEVSVSHSQDEIMQIQPIIQQPLSRLFSAAESEGIKLIVASSYRSIKDQQMLYQEFAEMRGAEAAAQFVATPGESEHHTGLAVDIDTYTSECALDSYACTLTPEDGLWLKDNAWRYGFILRYPEGSSAITGMSGETWHYRYVGVPLARLLHESDMTFDEFIYTAAPGRIQRELPIE